MAGHHPPPDAFSGWDCRLVSIRLTLAEGSWDRALARILGSGMRPISRKKTPGALARAQWFLYGPCWI